MNKDQLQELLMGAAVVALGYALYKHLKPATAAAPRPATPATTAAAPGLLSGLLNGTLTGLANDSAGYFNSMGNYQSTDDQIAAAAGVDTSGNDSIVKPGAWWYGL
jgi:putative effector of murein hydrolase